MSRPVIRAFLLLCLLSCSVTQSPEIHMSTQPLGAIVYREFDANGAPLAGGKLYTYAAGTTTPQATYTDSTGSVANANPVVLDAAGRADVWMTPGLLYRFDLKDSAGNLIRSEDNFPSPAAQTIGSTSAAVNDPGGRLTLSPTIPVPTTDLTGALVVSYLPYKNSFVPLFDGTNWALQSIGAGLSQTTTDTTKSPAAVAASSVYDMFVWSDSGIIRCTRGPAWSSDTVRGSGVGTSEIVQQNGRWVNKNAVTNGPGALLGLYVGTIRSDASLHINDSLALRHCWNTYNRVRRPMSVAAAASWTYTTATWRQAHADAANQLDYVQGLAEDAVRAKVVTAVNNAGGAAGTGMAVSIGVDSTTTPSAQVHGTATASGGAFPNIAVAVFAEYEGSPGKGRHVLPWLEFSNASGSTGWNNSVPSASATMGLIGDLPG